jgi:hypothetical protein
MRKSRYFCKSCNEYMWNKFLHYVYHFLVYDISHKKPKDFHLYNLNSSFIIVIFNLKIYHNVAEKIEIKFCSIDRSMKLSRFESLRLALILRLVSDLIHKLTFKCL